MKFFAIILVLLAAPTDATIDFSTSQLIDEIDIENSGSTGVAVKCPGKSCTLYTTKIASASVALYEGDVLKFTLKDAYLKEDCYLKGKSLPAGTNYFLRNTGDGIEPVKIYVVADAACTGFVIDFDSASSDCYLKPPGNNNIVTLLSSFSTGVAFSNYKGLSAPKIYSCGFDMIRSCKALYSASSVDNAAKSKIGIISALATVDFGSTDVNNQYQVAKFVDYTTSASIGQSFVAMSPGYTGCSSVLHNYNDVEINEYEFKAGSENTRVDIKFGDMRIAEGHEITIKATGQKDQKVTGTNGQSYSYTSTYLEVSISWDKQDKKNEYFYAQLDFSNGVSRAFFITPLITLLIRLM